MPDIFGYNRERKPKAVFSTENSLLTFGSGTPEDADGAGLLVQNWNINYAQQVQEVFELGSNTLYWVKGRPQGTGTIQRAVGPTVGARSQSLFPPEAYDLCLGGASFNMKVGAGGCPSTIQDSVGGQGTEVNINMDGCVVTSIGYNADVNDTRVIENVGWRFAFLEVS